MTIREQLENLVRRIADPSIQRAFDMGREARDAELREEVQKRRDFVASWGGSDAGHRLETLDWVLRLLDGGEK